MNIKERFLAIIDDIHERDYISQSEIERKCSMSSVISNIRNGKVDPSLITVCKLLYVFPRYNPDWLLLEKGSMLRGGGEIEELKDQIQKLINLNLSLQERLSEYERTNKTKMEET